MDLYDLVPYFSFPIPIVIFMMVGLLFSYRESLYKYTAITLSLIIFTTTLPVFGKLVTLPLLPRGSIDENVPSGAISAIVVPTGGIYSDGLGTWWAAQATVLRAAYGIQLHERIGAPLIISGGVTKRGGPAEADVVKRQFANLGETTVFDAGAGNTFETGQFVSRYLSNGTGTRKIIAVTTPPHGARLRMVLRSFGLDVAIMHATNSCHWAWVPEKRIMDSWRDFVPSTEGLRYFNDALREYGAISYYYLSGRI